MKKLIFGFCIIFSIITAFSAWKLVSLYLLEQRTNQAFETIRQEKEERTDYLQMSDEEETQNEDTPMDQYGSLADQNSDMVGWISIEGTTIDFPVMQTKDTPDYYLNHDFTKKENPYGVPYIDATCDLSKPSLPILIYGHHIKKNQMFTPLLSYLDETFRAEHPLIQFDTLTQFGTYEVIAVAKVSATADNENSFDFTKVAELTTEEKYNEYLNQIQTHSVFERTEETSFGDSLLILSTCEYSQHNGRILIVAKKIS